MPRPPVPPTLASLAAVAGLSDHFPEAAFHRDFLKHHPLELVREVGPRRFALPLLDPMWAADFGRRLMELHRLAEASGLRRHGPNTMNRYGVVLHTPDAVPLMNLDLLREKLMPILSAHYADHGGDQIDHHHGFIVRYAPNEDTELAFHADDAEVTLNVCLADGFTGGNLWFAGARCADHRDVDARPTEQGEWVHQPGMALIHAGADRHGAYPIQTGIRQNLILWMRSHAMRAPNGPRPDGWDAGCPDWCGARAI